MQGLAASQFKFILLSLFTSVALISCGGGSGGGGLPNTDTTAPTVINFTPTPAATGSNQTFPVSTVISATFDEAMDKNSVENGFVVTPNNGGTIVYDDSTNTATYTLANQNLQGATLYEITLKNSIKDKANNFLTEQTWSFTTLDNVSPTIVSFLPAKNAQNVGLQSKVILSFSEPITKASFDQNFTLEVDSTTGTGRTKIAGASKVNGNQVTFNPSKVLSANTTHYVTISQGIVDAKDNAMPAIPTYTFQTGTDKTRPSFTLKSPVNGAQDVSSKTAIVIEFSKKIATASLTPTNFRVQAQSELDSNVLATPINGTFTQTLSATNTYIVSFQPVKKLNLLNQYVITLTSDIVDEFSNPLIVPNGSPTTFRIKDGTWEVAAFPIQELPTKIISQYNIQTVFDNNGNRLVVWLERDALVTSNPPVAVEPYTTIRSRQFLNDGTGWQTTVTVANVRVPTSLLNTLHLAMNQKGNALLTWVQTDPAVATNFQLKSHRFIAGKWLNTPPEIITSGSSSNMPNHALAMLPDSSAISVWDVDVGGGVDSKILAKRFVPNNGIIAGVWSSTAEDVLQNNPDLKTANFAYLSHVGSVSLNNLGVAHVLYISHTTNSTGSVYALWSSQSPFVSNAPVRIENTLPDTNIVSIYSSQTDSGIVDVTWGLLNTTNNNEIWANHYNPATGWGSATQINTNTTNIATIFAPDHKTISFTDGNTIAVINQDLEPNYVPYLAQSGWGTTTPIGTSLARDNNSIHADQNNIVMSSWVSDTNLSGIMYNRYIPSKKTWAGEQPIFLNAKTITHKPSGNIMLSSLPNGTSYAVWAEFGPTNTDGTTPTFIYSIALEEK